MDQGQSCSKLGLLQTDRRRLGLLVVLGSAAIGCRSDPALLEAHRPPPSILLVTLDTTRADAVGFESQRVETPNLDALAASGLQFSQAYTTAPLTLPAHLSMMTGLYPADHGVHENARYFDDSDALLASTLQQRGYRTAAFVSGFPLSRQFGLATGFDHFDDDFGAVQAERRAGETTDRALIYLRDGAVSPLFLWVHYFDPHEPYDPPQPFRSRYPTEPYLGEIAYMDHELGRLLQGFEGAYSEGQSRIIVVGDHGEGLGDHGEALHGNLLYQGVMRVPLILAGSGISAGTIDKPVSIRRVYDTILSWACSEQHRALSDGDPETVLGEGMKPFLQYGWQPQVMAVRGHTKMIQSGTLEIYDLRKDPAELHNLVGQVEVDNELREPVGAYLSRAVTDSQAPVDLLSQQDKERLAALGYADWQGRTTLREDAPNPKDMAFLFRDLNAGSALFVRQEYARAIPVLDGVLAKDPNNLMVAIRLAVAHSVLGDEEQALQLFEQAKRIEPDSVDLQHYLAMHYFRFEQWSEAEPLLDSVLARMPNRLPALECLAVIHERHGRLDDASLLLERIIALKKEPLTELLKLGQLRMGVRDTRGAIQAFERARAMAGESFSHDLELGVCYLADRRLPEARDCLDRVSPAHPGYPMALFKRAQVSVLLGEPDQAMWIRRAYDNADSTTRRLIEDEPLFQGVALQ